MFHKTTLIQSHKRPKLYEFKNITVSEKKKKKHFVCKSCFTTCLGMKTPTIRVSDTFPTNVDLIKRGKKIFIVCSVYSFKSSFYLSSEAL